LRGAKRRGNLLDIRAVMRLLRFARNDKSALFGLLTKPSIFGFTVRNEKVFVNTNITGRIGEDSRFLFFARLWRAPFRSLPGAGSLLSNQLCHNLNVIGVRKHVNRLDFGYLVITAHFSKISC